MRHLVVCCDGTWQDVAQQSNVSRLHAASSRRRALPEPLYVQGVGVSRNPVDVLRGGLIGAGLSAGITQGYRWLAREFRPGDRIAVFGFSRGAYTARSLAGMIGRVGLVDGSGLGPRELDDAVERAYQHYRDIGTPAEDPSWNTGLDLAYRPGDPDIPVEFVGVWDTVGALGIPTYVGIPDVVGSREAVPVPGRRAEPAHQARLGTRCRSTRCAVRFARPSGATSPRGRTSGRCGSPATTATSAVGTGRRHSVTAPSTG